MSRVIVYAKSNSILTIENSPSGISDDTSRIIDQLAS